ncbi:hypothetical protein RB595_001856 [Gaeumannomyces hyphopodioides]
MCGPDNSTKPRGGALVVLRNAMAQEATDGCAWSGELNFHTPGQPESSIATHVRVTAGDDSSLDALLEAVVLIHQSGDLSMPARECGLLRAFALTHAAELEDGVAMELELATPMPIQVGDDGIIGRRVSIFRQAADSCFERLGPSMAEGIVGFNFMPSSRETSPDSS